MENTKNRMLSYDIIRIIAIAMVVLIHSSTEFVANYLPPSADFMWGNVLDSISRAGVPLFVMLSGALMLNEHKNVSTQYIVKHVISMALMLIVWSLIYAVGSQILLPILKHEPISLKSFVGHFILGHYHLWFLYMIIGLYLVTPILRLFVKKTNKKYIFYFIVLALLFQFTVPVLNFVSNLAMGSGDYFKVLIDKFHMDFVGPYITYYLMGWYISSEELTKKSRSIIYILGALGLVVSITGTQFFITENNEAYYVFYSNSSINVFLYSAAVYTFVFYHLQNKKIKSARINKCITELSKLSFGVYTMHIVILTFINKLFFDGKPGFTIPLLWISVLIISYIFTFIASKIPLIKKLVKC